MSECNPRVVTWGTLPHNQPINLCQKCADKYPHKLTQVLHGEHKGDCDGTDWHPSDGANPRHAEQEEKDNGD